MLVLARYALSAAEIFTLNSYDIHQEDRRLFECYKHITCVSLIYHSSSRTNFKVQGPTSQKCRKVFVLEKW